MNALASSYRAPETGLSVSEPRAVSQLDTNTVALSASSSRSLVMFFKLVMDPLKSFNNEYAYENSVTCPFFSYRSGANFSDSPLW